MAVNVRCDGTRSEIDWEVIFDACGWRGERFEVYRPTHPELAGPGQWAINLDKPCPRCGGQVELISRDLTETAS